MGGSANNVPSEGDQLRNNAEAAYLSFFLNNPNTFTPFGSLNYTPQRDAQGNVLYDVVNGRRFPRQQANFRFSEPLQRQFEQQNRINQGVGGATEGALNRARTALNRPIDLSGLPQLQGQVDVGDPQRELDKIKLPDVTGAGDFSADRQRIEERLFDVGRRRVDERFRGEREALDQRLANQGLAPGSRAYDEEVRRFEDQRNRAYQEAQDSAFTGAGGEQSRLFGLNSGARQQLFGENTQRGTFANQAQQLAFQQGLAGAELGNQTRQQGLNETFYLRDRPLQEFQTLRGNIAAPQLPNLPTPQGQAVTPGSALNAYQARAASRASNPFSQLIGVGGQIAGYGVGSALNGGK